MKIYLAGRCGGRKIKLLPRVCKSEYLASDLWDHNSTLAELVDFDYVDCHMSHAGEHSWPVIDHCAVGDRDAIVRKYAEPLVYDSDLMIAYVDDPLAFGTIAEIGMANARNIPIFMFILEPEHPTNANTEAETSAYVDAWRSLDDAYWFVSRLSNVRAVRSEDFSDFSHIVQQIDQIESPIEFSLYLAIADGWYHELKQLFTQYRVGKYRLDFAFPDKKLAVECDGHAYHSTRDQRGRDADRDRELIAQGWTVIRFTGSQIHQNPERCADEVRRILYARAAIA